MATLKKIFKFTKCEDLLAILSFKYAAAIFLLFICGRESVNNIAINVRQNAILDDMLYMPE